jgi:hypothetical protein
MKRVEKALERMSCRGGLRHRLKDYASGYRKTNTIKSNHNPENQGAPRHLNHRAAGAVA